MEKSQPRVLHPEGALREVSVGAAADPQRAITPEELFGPDYYRTGCGPVPYERNETWLAFFSRVAGEIVRCLAPGSVLDAGCAMGFLVEALRDRGVDARGIDISSYAVSRARSDIGEFCLVGSVIEPLGGPYDLITCIEVLEHLPPGEVGSAIDRLTEAGDTILFSSTPDDFTEPTHFSVQPTIAWLRQFAERGFYPDAGFDAGFLTPHAMLLRRGSPQPDDTLRCFAELLRVRGLLALQGSPWDGPGNQRQAALTAAANDSSAPGNGGEAEMAARERRIEALSELIHEREEFRFENEILRRRLDLATSSPAWRILSRYRCWLRQAVWSRPALRRLYEPLAQRLLGAFSAKASAAEETARKSHAGEVDFASGRVNESILREALGGDSVIVACDLPPANLSSGVTSDLQIQGWAVAKAGVREVLVSIDGSPPRAASYGLRRSDVGKHLFEFPAADRSGFYLFWDETSLGDGRHKLTIEVHSHAGERCRLVREFVVDGRDPYAVWIENNEAPPQTPRAAEITALSYRPRISILTPCYKSPRECLEACVQSVLGQLYPHWELCLVDDGSADPELSRLLESYAARDSRIRVDVQEVNSGIAAATNRALGAASGDYVAFLDHDDSLSPDALLEVVRALNSDSSIDVLYSDEDKISVHGKRFDPFFKPDYSPDLLRSCNYVCHLLTVRRALLEKVGGLRPGFDQAQDYDLILRLSEATPRFKHIPKVLYHWRAVPGSAALGPEAKPRASGAGREALRQHLERLGTSAEVIEIGPSRYQVRYEVRERPEVGVIMPTGGNMERLRDAVSSVLESTEYGSFRIVIADNSRGPEVQQYVAALGVPARVRCLDYRGLAFNFSFLCNAAARELDAPLYLFLNDDVKVSARGWLAALVEHGLRPEVGVVGARLLFPDRTIQHAGIALGVFGTVGHAFRGLPANRDYFFAFPNVVRNCSAVTGACLMTRRDVFREVDGFDEVHLPVAFQDADLCLRVIEKGYRVVYTPFAELYHFESATKRAHHQAVDPAAVRYFQERWKAAIANDPYYSPHLSRRSEDFAIRIDH